jgi:pyruvate dehydrogenase E2 component (dihydrolipoamide acetyltransferase)
MPQMGESIAEGTVSVWLKKLGDLVNRDEPIMEISTDKVDAEIPSPSAGVLVEILVQEGETVEVGTVVAFIETEAGAIAGTTSPVPEPAAGSPEEEPATPVATEAQPTAQRDADHAASPEAAPGTDDGYERPADELEERLRRRSSPLVRRIAAEHNIRLEALQGSGRAGRVTKEDILTYLEEGAPAGDMRQAGVRDGRGRRTAGDADALTWDEFYTHVEHPSVTIGPRDRAVPMNRMTQLIAEHMVLSRRISAHVHSYFEIDFSRVDQAREANRSTWDAQGVKITYTAFIARAVAQALRDHPKINASISGDRVVFRGEVNLGIAVALENGLIVPVVRNADELSLVGLARAISDMASRARAKKLSPEEVQGGTFTITNPGIFGTVIGFPIVNQPQVAILGVGAVEKRPVVITDEFGKDAIAIRKRAYLALGYDHRLVNGADGDQFLARVKELLETVPEAG